MQEGDKHYARYETTGWSLMKDQSLEGEQTLIRENIDIVNYVEVI